MQNIFQHFFGLDSVKRTIDISQKVLHLNSQNVLVLAVDYFTDYPTDKIGE